MIRSMLGHALFAITLAFACAQALASEVRLRIERDGNAMRVNLRSADRASFLKSPRLH